MPAFVRTSGMIYMVLNSYMFYGQNGGVLKKILRRIGILLAVLLVVCIGYVFMSWWHTTGCRITSP